MPYFSTITEAALRDMARNAASLFLDGRATPTDAVIKAASASGQSLTDQHARRICEMTYRDIFERSFRASPGPDRVVNFDPPDAEKVASALRAARIESFSDKLASTQHGGASMDKIAHRAPSPPPARNAFLAGMEPYRPNSADMKKEARGMLRDAIGRLREAESAFKTEISTLALTEKVALIELLDLAVDTVHQGNSGVEAITACVDFAKSAGVMDDTLEGLAADLARGMIARKIDVAHEKAADYSQTSFNPRHPLRAQAVKVAGLRENRVHREIALRNIQSDLRRVEQELKDALYQ